tara:strand:+ start:1232 stop:1384 length:153 start_codon:yes stop_codon:yes gene_type:complete
MNVNDLDKILAEYIKHFGKDKVKQYFEKIIKIGGKNAISKEKVNNRSRSN